MAEADLKELSPRFPVPRDVREAIARTIGHRPPTTFYERYCNFAGKIFKLKYEMSEKGRKTLRDAGLNVSGSSWAAGFLLTILLPLSLTLAPFFAGLISGASFVSLLYLPLAGIVLTGLLLIAFCTYPSSRASSLRSEAQSQAINTILLLSFAMHHRPDLRGATVYASDVGRGKLAEDLQRGLLELEERHGYETVRHLLTVTANEWGEIDESTRAAIFDLLRSTGQREEAARLLDVAKAPQRMLEGAESQLGKRLSRMVMPTMSFLVFGSLALLGVVGLAPVWGMIGAGFMDLKFFVLASVSLIAAFLAFTTYMGRQRPVTLPPPEIPEDDPRLPRPGKTEIAGRFVPVWPLAFVVFLVLSWPGVLYLMGVTGGILGIIAFGFGPLWFIWGVAAALIVYFHASSSRIASLREEERKKVGDWETALNTIGSRMLDGKPMGEAISEAAGLMEGSPLAGQLREVAVTIEREAIDLHCALFERGYAKRIHNPLVVSFLDIITRIRRSSELAAGRACMMAGEFLAMFRRVERSFKEKIDEAMGSVWLVAVLLLPIVCAMSVWVMEFMSGMSFSVAEHVRVAGLAGIPLFIGGMEATELALLRLVMGLTAIALAVVLARYVATVRAGHDRTEFEMTAARTVLLTAMVFTATSFLLATVRMSI